MGAETPPEMAGYEEYGGAEPEGSDDASAPFMLEQLAQWDGNIAELFQDSEAGKKKLEEIGALVVREYELDESSRAEWKASAVRALASAGQKKGEDKTYPFNKAANVKFPLLTSAAIQFAARAYPNIVRGDEVVAVKVVGEDADGAKAERSQRVADFSNDQLLYQCPEWEPGTDALLHQLPVTGAGFRKVYWDTALNRPRFDYAPALKVVIPIDAPSLEMAPRVTHVLDAVYPHEYEAKVANGTWLKCEVQNTGTDTQKPYTFLEQCRYIDMDDDGLSEPYIVVAHKDTGKVVRIDPAFDVEDIKRKPANENGEPGKITAIDRLLPWVEYTFLPDPEGGAYGIGFGKLLEAISDTINTLLNQMIDAGHWSNTNTGFIGAGVKVRGGTISLEPNMFKMLDGVQDVNAAIKRLEFPGPSSVSFNLVEMLLGAAKDITAIKDVLAGEMPGGQHVAEGTVLALIEQGLQVFTSIYKRIYRSMRKEFELQARLNARYLDPAKYQAFLDARPKPPPQAQNAPPQQPPAGLGHNGGPPMGPDDMGGAPIDPNAMGGEAGMMGDAPPPPQMGEVLPFPQQQPAPPMAPGAPMQQAPMQSPPSPAEDFAAEDMDIRPVADPTAITDMQRMAKAQFKLKFIDDPNIDRKAVLKSVWRDARISNIEEFIVERNPAMEKQMQLQEALGQAELAIKQADAQAKGAAAEKAKAEAEAKSGEPQIKARELDQRDRELAQRDIELTQERDRIAIERYKADMEDADKELRLVLEQARDQRSEAEKFHDAARDDHHRAADRAHALELAKAKSEGKAEKGPKAMVKIDGREEIAKAVEDVRAITEAQQSEVAATMRQQMETNNAVAAALASFAEAVRKSSLPREIVRDPKTGKALRTKIVEEAAA